MKKTIGSAIQPRSTRTDNNCSLNGSRTLHFSAQVSLQVGFVSIRGPGSGPSDGEVLTRLQRDMQCMRTNSNTCARLL